MPPLKILQVAAEAAPLAKTGGLGDVTAALARYLGERGDDARLFLPFYAAIDRHPGRFVAVDFLRDVDVEMGGRHYRFTAYTTRLPGTRQAVYLIDCPAFYRRPGIYSQQGDEPLRFAFLSRAALECCQRMGWAPDIVHAHDWHTALLPLLLKTVYSWDRLFARSRTVLTIHNVGYQGVFEAEILPRLGLETHAGLFDQEDLASGRVSFLKTGILYADFLTTVSPTHAREIQSEEYGMGLTDLLRRRHDHLVGILNGVDYLEWDPQTDPHLPFAYGASNLAGKAGNRQHLLDGMGLDASPEAPAIGVVSRLVYQKGIDLMIEVLPALLAARDVRLVVLGSGERRYEEFFVRLQRRFPGRVCYYRGFSNELAHLIEGGCDLFLMPSLYEPCGLNQMYSLRYGTVPVVRRTGGLADAVEPFDPTTGSGTGFVFDHYDAGGLGWALDLALKTYRQPELWSQVVANGMAQDFSWERQIEHYRALYRGLAGR